MHPHDSENMTKEQALQWLIEFGAFAHVTDLSDTWADRELHWAGCVDNGWLTFTAGRGFTLTPKTMTLIEEADYED